VSSTLTSRITSCSPQVVAYHRLLNRVYSISTTPRPFDAEVLDVSSIGLPSSSQRRPIHTPGQVPRARPSRTASENRSPRSSGTPQEIVSSNSGRHRMPDTRRHLRHRLSLVNLFIPTPLTHLLTMIHTASSTKRPQHRRRSKKKMRARHYIPAMRKDK